VTHPALRTRLCELLGVEYPIVQTGMGWVSTPVLVAATANAGGFGILGAATMDLDDMERAVKETKALTDKPFGVNMRADQPDLHERADLLIQEGVRAASFAMAPRVEVVSHLRRGGVLVIPTVGARRHAEKVAALGVDALVVQGSEGGGHTGPVHTTVLLPQVVDAAGDLPVIAAGGFFDGRGLVAALAYGASGIAMGTRFMLTEESPVPDSIKLFYLGRSVTDAVVTRKVDGVPHRVLRTPFIDRLERGGETGTLLRAIRSAMAFKKESGTSWRQMLREGRAMRRTHDLTWSQVIMAANTPVLLRAAMVEGRTDIGVMASGQVVGLIDDIPAVSELVSRIVGEAEGTLARFRDAR
jgi:NAD(P)H-dependent flavin oxidoreductase YrpB (nitropropane dioxygenase family)